MVNCSPRNHYFDYVKAHKENDLKMVHFGIEFRNQEGERERERQRERETLDKNEKQIDLNLGGKLTSFHTEIKIGKNIKKILLRSLF